MPKTGSLYSQLDFQGSQDPYESNWIPKEGLIGPLSSCFPNISDFPQKTDFVEFPIFVKFRIFRAL